MHVPSKTQKPTLSTPVAAPAPGTPKASTPELPATGTADDTTLHSGKVDLSTKKNADGTYSTYSLEDSTRGKGVVTVDAQNKSQAGRVPPITDTNDVWGEATDPSRNKAAVDAHYGAEMTYGFLKDVLGRDSLDGKEMNDGDGGGKQSGPLTTLDIAGHEIAHGLPGAPRASSMTRSPAA